MAKVITQTIDIPVGVTRWWITKMRETNETFANPLNEIFSNKANNFTMTQSLLANGKTRMTTINKFATLEDYNRYVAFMAPFEAARDAYNTANNIDFTQTITEE
jgi:hypothetical protein